MDLNPFSLKDKLILVTGASSGIGRQCAITCSEMGARMVLFGRNMDRLRETQSLTNDPDKHFVKAIDLLEYSNISDAVKGIVVKEGKINGLINCAGISTTLPLHAITPSKMDHFFRSNVVGALNLTNQVVKPSNFSKEGGSIIFISSVMGVVGENGKALYSLTKGALISTVRSLAIEFAKRKIRINAISPGVVESPMSTNAIYNRDKDSLDRISSLHPLGLGQPSDVANAAVYLLSDAAEWITGTNLVVDGGYLAR